VVLNPHYGSQGKVNFNISSLKDCGVFEIGGQVRAAVGTKLKEGTGTWKELCYGSIICIIHQILLM
jgi:hypothetical protein